MKNTEIKKEINELHKKVTNSLLKELPKEKLDSEIKNYIKFNNVVKSFDNKNHILYTTTYSINYIGDVQNNTKIIAYTDITYVMNENEECIDRKFRGKAIYGYI